MENPKRIALYLLFAICALCGIGSCTSASQDSDGSGQTKTSTATADSNDTKAEPNISSAQENFQKDNVSGTVGVSPYKAESLGGILETAGIASPCSPIVYRSSPLGAVVDVNGDGNDDAIVICVIGKNSVRRLSELSKDARLYEDSFQSVEIAAAVLTYDSGSETPAFTQQIIPIGIFRVVKSFKPIDLGSTVPSSFELTGMNENSTIRVWIICGRKVSTLRIIESPKKQATVEDIDNDGVTDVIMYDKVFEEGAGEETFLSWYRWNGSNYIEYSNTNIVRNLNSFLYQISNLIERKNWYRFKRYALNNEVQSFPLDGAFSNSEVFNGVFSPVRSGTAVDPRTIKAVKFQEILENPFRDSVRRVSVSCKVVTDSEFYYTVDVVLSDNPFIQPQYVLAWSSAP